MRKMIKAVFATVLVLLFLLLPQAACADENDGADAHAKRTILLYVCGTNLETNNAMASYNLRQILQANFSEDDDINVIVMTGGANRWHLESKYLAFPEDVDVQEDAVADDEGQSVDKTSQISNVYNQIWEARGADAKIDGEADPNAGKLVLLDGDGISKSEPVKSEEEPVIDPATLKTFINWGQLIIQPTSTISSCGITAADPPAASAAMTTLCLRPCPSPASWTPSVTML